MDTAAVPEHELVRIRRALVVAPVVAGCRSCDGREAPPARPATPRTPEAPSCGLAHRITPSLSICRGIRNGRSGIPGTLCAATYDPFGASRITRLGRGPPKRAEPRRFCRFSARADSAATVARQCPGALRSGPRRRSAARRARHRHGRHVIALVAAGAARGSAEPDPPRSGDVAADRHLAGVTPSGNQYVSFTASIGNLGPGPFIVHAVRADERGDWRVSQRFASTTLRRAERHYGQHGLRRPRARPLARPDRSVILADPPGSAEVLQPLLQGRVLLLRPGPPPKQPATAPDRADVRKDDVRRSDARARDGLSPGWAILPLGPP